MNQALTLLLDAAVRAPSGDNTQPWRFTVDEQAGRIHFFVDETRDPSPMNAGQRMARIAVGAALENVLCTAATNRWEVELEPFTVPALAAVRVRTASRAAPAPNPVVTDRVTNRRLYDGRPVPTAVLHRLTSKTPASDGVSTHWIIDRARLAALASLIGRADALMFGEKSMRRAFLHNIRFDAPPTAEVEQGLSLASLELSRKDLLALKALRWMPGWALRASGGMKAFAANARRLVESASGLCLIVAGHSGCAADIAVGRSMERAWLALTAERMAVQPMMSLAVLDNARVHGRRTLVDSLGPALPGLFIDVNRLAPEIGRDRLGYVFRFGYAPPVSGRTGRRPVSAVAQG